MKIYYNDNIDCLCASSIVISELRNSFVELSKKDIIAYRENFRYVKIPDEISVNEEIYIIGIKLDDKIFSAIKHFIENGCKVTYIDNHYSVQEYYSSKEYDKTILNSMQMFCINKNSDVDTIPLSNTMLTWVYSCMDSDERIKCDEVDFDFTSDFSLLAINPYGKVREYFIPFAIRYIDDAITRNNIHESGLFYIGLLGYADGYKDLRPDSKLWVDLIYNNKMLPRAIIDTGTIIDKYEKNIKNMKSW